MLNASEVRYVVVGAHAVMHHTEPRTTGDIDVYVDRSADNLGRLERALVEFLGPEGRQVRALAEERRVFFVGREPWRVDLLNHVDGLPFEVAWNSREAGVYGDVPIAVPSLDAMILAKEAVVAKRRAGAKGEQDRADLERLRDAKARGAGGPPASRS